MAGKGKSIALPLMLVSLSIPLLFCQPLQAQTPAPVPGVSITFGKTGTPGDVAVTIQILILLTILTLAPSILMMMTSFTRIVVVLHFVKQALGAQGTPPAQVVIGLSLFLTMFIMQKPVTEIYNRAWKPYERQECTIQEAFAVSQEPLKEFMMRQTREKDLALFARMADIGQPATPNDLPLKVIVPGFIISELRIAFQIGFMVYLPFLIIDMVVASILVSMGMMMLPPVMISLPFKVLMFVLVDGWYLVVDSLVKGIR